jgi:hypothetical protein
MAYLIPIYRSLTMAGVLCLAAACDHASALLQMNSLSENGAPVELDVGKCINMAYPIQEAVLGAVVDPDDLMEVDWGDTSVYACCARKGTGTMQVTLLTDNGTVFKAYPTTCNLPPLPLPETPKVGIWVNFSEPFRAIGRTVERLAILPNDLGSQMIRNALLANSVGADVVAAGQVPISTDAGDIGLECEREGEGSVVVFFDDSGPSPIEYALTCHVHDQGGGG